MRTPGRRAEATPYIGSPWLQGDFRSRDTETQSGTEDYTSFTKFAPKAIDGVSAPESVDASTRSTAAREDFTVKLYPARGQVAFFKTVG